MHGQVRLRAWALQERGVNGRCPMRLTMLAILGTVACRAPASSGPGTEPDATDDGAVDAAQAVDGPAAFLPIHVLPETLMSGAPDLVLLANPSAIDTSALTI